MNDLVSVSHLMFKFIRKAYDRVVGGRPDSMAAGSDEVLRREFKLRYMQFRRLLNANDKVLKTIAEMESVLMGNKPFGMSFIRSRCALLFVNVYQIIQHLNVLSGQRHKALFPAFSRLQDSIRPLLENHPLPPETPLVLDMATVDNTYTEAAGVKMASLGNIAKQLKVTIPQGFVISATAYHRFMSHHRLQEEINQRIQSHDGESIDQRYHLSSILQQLIIGAPVPDDLADAIRQAVTDLQSQIKQPPALAVRSSCISEDLPGASFAGQYRSVLNVPPDQILNAFKEVIAGKYSATAMSYRFHRGLRDEDLVMCVGCLQMVDAVAGGVLYTRNPLDIRDDTLIINSVWGLPKMVVDGRSAVDLFVVSRRQPPAVLDRQVAVKTVAYRCLEQEGLRRQELSDEQGREPSLTDEQILTLAELGLAVEAYYGQAQDIEWAVDQKGEIILLQSRPLSLSSPKTEVSDQTPRPAPSIDPKTHPVLLSGRTTASPGVGTGNVRVLQRMADTLQFSAGEVMVIRQSLPEYAVLLDRTAAVIAELGSVSSHLANVAREYQVPALFGVENALTGLQNGREVTVDADGQKVYQGRVDVLLKTVATAPHVMAGTPVYQTLKQVMPYIAPLTLLNPDAPTFTPEHCTSLHDIIRYCHEKSVHEMFAFGRDNAFPKRSSKQLTVNVPMQWWILNLDDGFAEEVDGPRVRLDNITSIPMLAIWQGITRVPWQGPPPIDGAGLLSVMFEATRNTALIPTVRSQYAQRNYFMIARNYCSLMSRFGFHFSTAESYVSERVPENYVIFRFKGGAADDFRRTRRVHLIAEVLEEVGFAVSMTEDALSARFEDYPMAIMQNRLNIVGYLTMHTRQLDMVMSRDAMFEHYRRKISADIKRLFPEPETVDDPQS